MRVCRSVYQEEKMKFVYRALEQTAAGSGVIQDIVPTGADTQEATENAVQSVQTVTSFFHLPTWVGRLLFILIVLLLAIQLLKFANKFFDRMIDGVRQSGTGSGTLLIFIKNIVRVLIYFVAAIIIIYSVPGAKSYVNMLLASGGVIALIVSVAGQDVLGNIAGGVMVLAFRPFVVGDHVTYLDKDVSGIVEEITIRHTIIRTGQNRRVIVPNGTINGSVIQNSDFGDSVVCDFFEVGITYESDMEKAIRVLREEVAQHPLQLDQRTPEQVSAGEQKVKVRVVELADSAVVLRAWLWAKDNASLFDLRFDLNYNVKNRFDAEGIEFAYPHIMMVEKNP